MLMFELKSSYSPAGDQPKAIQEIKETFEKWKSKATLLWATWTGKTFTMANIINHIQKPTLVISHNKTLAAQLATEFKNFFPNNAVHYFVSYFDYYQPESYLPAQWLYIEKEATINQEIEMYRLATMASLLSRKDVIVVASVSSLYGLGQKRFFEENCLQLQTWKQYKFKDLKKQLLHIQYKPVHGKIEHGMFDVKWETIDIFSSTEKFLYRLHFNEEELELIELRDSLTYEYKGKTNKIVVRPASQFIQDMSDLDNILIKMDIEKNNRVKEFEKKWMLVEAERIKKRVEYDIRMIKETWFVNGIENYSLYFDKRIPGQAPSTLFEYFPDDFLMIIDESHMTIPQLQAMPSGDRARKVNLIKYWFRLPSAIDHRPINFGELESKLWRIESDPKEIKEKSKKELKVINDKSRILEERLENKNNALWETYEKLKKSLWYQNDLNSELFKKHIDAKTIFLSATPAQYELNISEKIVEQIIRPTWLLDPITYVYPKDGNYQSLANSLDKLIKNRPHLEEFMNGYKIKAPIKEIFAE